VWLSIALMIGPDDHSRVAEQTRVGNEDDDRPIPQLILGAPLALCQDAAWLFCIGVFLPLGKSRQFGHHTVGLPLIGGLSFWKILVISPPWVSVTWPGSGPDRWDISRAVCVGHCGDGQIPICKHRASDHALLTNLLLYALGTFIWTGTIFGYALAPGDQATDCGGADAARKILGHSWFRFLAESDGVRGGAGGSSPATCLL